MKANTASRNFFFIDLDLLLIKFLLNTSKYVWEENEPYIKTKVVLWSVVSMLMIWTLNNLGDQLDIFKIKSGIKDVCSSISTQTKKKKITEDKIFQSMEGDRAGTGGLRISCM